jgi:hypothetical protein
MNEGKIVLPTHRSQVLKIRLVERAGYLRSQPLHLELDAEDVEAIRDQG